MYIYIFHTYIRIMAYIHMYIHAYIYKYIRTYTHAYIHIYYINTYLKSPGSASDESTQSDQGDASLTNTSTAEGGYLTLGIFYLLEFLKLFGHVQVPNRGRVFEIFYLQPTMF